MKKLLILGVMVMFVLALALPVAARSDGDLDATIGAMEVVAVYSNEEALFIDKTDLGFGVGIGVHGDYLSGFLVGGGYYHDFDLGYWEDTFALLKVEATGPVSKEDYGIRFDKIDDEAFENATGVTTVQMSAGNGNILQSAQNVLVLNDVCDADLQEVNAKIYKTVSFDDYDKRFDKISGEAFQNATGITTVQMSSGNGNILQAGLNVQVELPNFVSDVDGMGDYTVVTY